MKSPFQESAVPPITGFQPTISFHAYKQSSICLRQYTSPSKIPACVVPSGALSQSIPITFLHIFNKPVQIHTSLLSVLKTVLIPHTSHVLPTTTPCVDLCIWDAFWRIIKDSLANILNFNTRKQLIMLRIVYHIVLLFFHSLKLFLFFWCNNVVFRLNLLPDTRNLVSSEY